MKLDKMSFSNIIDKAGDLVIVYSSDNTIVEVNESVCHKLGFTRNELIAHPVSTIFPDRYNISVSDFFDNVGESNSFLSTTKLIRKTDYSIPVEINCNKISYENNDIFLCIARDIGGKKKTEHELEKEHQRIGHIMCEAKIGLWEVDPLTDRLTFPYKNSYLLGYSDEDKEVVSRFDFISLLHPDDRERVETSFSSLVAGKSSSYTEEYRLLAKDGYYRWIQTSGLVTERDENGKPLMVTGLIIDVTDRKVAEELLKGHAEELESSNDLKDLFVDILKHDLINPISSANGFSDVLLKIEENEYKKDILEGIKTSIDNMSSIISLASRFAKFESISGVDKERYDISALLQKTISEFELDILIKKISVIFNSEGPYYVSANAAIKEVFANFMSNAIKYSPENTTIQIKVFDEGLKWKVEFIDEGFGVEDEYKPLIFERFERGNARGIKGTGLGLAIVKRVADLHGMEVGVSDNPDGKGSCFWITLQKARNDHDAFC